MFSIVVRAGQLATQILASIGGYELFTKFLDSPQPDESSIEVERRFSWAIKGLMMILVAFLSYKLLKKKK